MDVRSAVLKLRHPDTLLDCRGHRLEVRVERSPDSSLRFVPQTLLKSMARSTRARPELRLPADARDLKVTIGGLNFWLESPANKDAKEIHFIAFMVTSATLSIGGRYAPGRLLMPVKTPSGVYALKVNRTQLENKWRAGSTGQQPPGTLVIIDGNGSIPDGEQLVHHECEVYYVASTVPVPDFDTPWQHDKVAFGAEEARKLVQTLCDSVGTGRWASGYVEFEVGPPEKDGAS